MAFTQKHIDTLAELGFIKPRIDTYGDLVAWVPESGADDLLVCREEDAGIRAWIVTERGGMRTPKTITSSNKNGCSPQYRFKSVKEAAQKAIDNPYY